MVKKEDKKEKDASQAQQSQSVSDFENNNGWTEHSDGEVLKLEPSDSITGILIDKSISHKYNDCGIYKITVDNDPVPKVILGSKQLDRLMATIDIGKVIKIIFEGTQPSDKGNPMKVFKVFTKE